MQNATVWAGIAAVMLQSRPAARLLIRCSAMLSWPQIRRLIREHYAESQGASVQRSDQSVSALHRRTDYLCRYLSSTSLNYGGLRPRGDLRALVVIADIPGDTWNLATIDGAREQLIVTTGLGDIPATILSGAGNLQLNTISKQMRDGCDWLPTVLCVKERCMAMNRICGWRGVMEQARGALVDWPFRWHLLQAQVQESVGNWDAALDLLDLATSLPNRDKKE